MNYIRIEKRGDIALCWLDNPEEKVNVLNKRLLDEFKTAVDQIDKDSSIKASVVISAKSDTFIAGADLQFLRKMERKSDVLDFNIEGNALLNRVAKLKKPVRKNLFSTKDKIKN